jgi:uncharacterized protein (UPF0335 family)
MDVTRLNASRPASTIFVTVKSQRQQFSGVAMDELSNAIKRNQRLLVHNRRAITVLKTERLKSWSDRTSLLQPATTMFVGFNSSLLRSNISLRKLRKAQAQDDPAL